MTHPTSMLVVRESEVVALLDDQDDAVLEIVRQAYIRHDAGDTVLPQSTFLRLPGAHGERIIALPAYLGGETPIAGLKWIASFPQNRLRGLARATGTVILSCPQTGRSLAILGGAAISALRTAASAALTADLVWRGAPPASIGVIGCGRIGTEILRLLTRRWPSVWVCAYDADAEQRVRFRARCADGFAVTVTTVPSATEVLMADVDILVLATTEVTSWIEELGAKPPRLVLHVSLRDLAPEVIVACQNVVDDVAHVCRQGTSIHRTAERLGHHRFIGATIGELLRGAKNVRTGGTPVVVSPFGLGILDVAVGTFVYRRAWALGVGTVIEDTVVAT